MIDQKTLGKTIKELRKLKGLTQEQFAEKIGIGSKHLSRIEQGQHNPTFNILQKISQALDFDIYNIDRLKNLNCKTTDKIYLQSLKILNSAKTDKEKEYFLEALKHAQKGIKIGRTEQ